ncbi:sulfotransferase domain-containing protein [Aliiruegeria sabulilitoris]|uniref:sulfotransferase domain-containing protein n=1 Tax=Aliiruegeria sabulilitoris TaxID=1510458 RepID=UPI000833DC27|nr:sulfotransferase domain-containing protein [Aliiruegeria sabulilitoris]NDR57073.1 sulfotransferase domain-containing protein [Pseudoruegeria sp. M32A2M]
MHFPDFFIVGAAKAGTTSLTSQLKACSSVFMTTPKEPEFFARDDRFALGPEWYAAHFAEAKPGQITGESSTIHALAPYFPRAAKRIAEAAPQARIIYMVRHPVARSYSMYLEVLKHYQNDNGTGEVNRSFEEFLFPERFPERAPREKVFARFDAHLPDDPGLFLDGSDYALQAGEYLRHFPRDQIRFILFEDYVKDIVDNLASVLAFLGLDPEEAETATAYEARNTSSDHFSTTAQQQQVADFKRRFVPAWINDALPESWRAGLRRALLSVNRATGVKTVVPPPMTAETRAWLTRHFASRYEEIERLTGLDLTPWREIDAKAG